MIKLKPGQFAMINGTLYRAKKRDHMHILDCQGCALNNFISCPNIAFANCERPISINCEEDGIILIKV